MPAPESDRSNLAVLRMAWRLLSFEHRRRIPWLVTLSLLMAFGTLGGIAAVVPFFAVLADPGAIERHALLSWLRSATGFVEPRGFLVFLACGFVAVVLVASLLGLFGSRALQRFAMQVGRDFQVRLFDRYLHRGYPFHLSNSPAKLANIVIGETSRAVSGRSSGVSP